MVTIKKSRACWVVPSVWGCLLLACVVHDLLHAGPDDHWTQIVGRVIFILVGASLILVGIASWQLTKIGLKLDVGGLSWRYRGEWTFFRWEDVRTARIVMVANEFEEEEAIVVWLHDRARNPARSVDREAWSGLVPRELRDVLGGNLVLLYHEDWVWAPREVLRYILCATDRLCA